MSWSMSEANQKMPAVAGKLNELIRRMEKFDRTHGRWDVVREDTEWIEM